MGANGWSSTDGEWSEMDRESWVTCIRNRMPLPLERTLRREVVVAGAPYTVTLSPLGVKLVRKGFRRGRAVSWRALLALLERVDAPEAPAADAEAGAPAHPPAHPSDPPSDHPPARRRARPPA